MLVALSSKIGSDELAQTKPYDKVHSACINTLGHGWVGGGGGGGEEKVDFNF